MLLTRRRLLLGGMGLATTMSAGGAYAGFVEPGLRLLVTRYHPRPAAWPADLNLTIAVIADVHAGWPNMTRARLEEIVAVTNSLAPDLIVHLGDHEASGSRLVMEPLPAEIWGPVMGGLRAPLGVHSVLGNHDWWHNGEVVRRTAERHLGLLENQALRIAHGGRHFWLAGLGDQLAHRLGRQRFRGVDDLAGTLAQLTTDEPAILLAHEPDIFPEVPDRFALTLSGHTHGGQVWFPGMPPVFIPSRYGARFRYGHIVEEGRHLIVSGGLGTSNLPVRFGVPPEIVLVRLGGAPAALLA